MRAGATHNDLVQVCLLPRSSWNCSSSALVFFAGLFARCSTLFKSNDVNFSKHVHNYSVEAPLRRSKKAPSLVGLPCTCCNCHIPARHLLKLFVRLPVTRLRTQDKAFFRVPPASPLYSGQGRWRPRLSEASFVVAPNVLFGAFFGWFIGVSPLLLRRVSLDLWGYVLILAYCCCHYNPSGPAAHCCNVYGAAPQASHTWTGVQRWKDWPFKTAKPLQSFCSFRYLGRHSFFHITHTGKEREEPPTPSKCFFFVWQSSLFLAPLPTYSLTYVDERCLQLMERIPELWSSGYSG